MKILLISSLLMLNGCTASTSIKNQRTIIGIYVYQGSQPHVSLALKEDSSSVFIHRIAMFHKYRKGRYSLLPPDTLILNSVYTGNWYPMPVSWKHFIQEKIKIDPQRIFYEEYPLKKLSKRKAILYSGRN